MQHRIKTFLPSSLALLLMLVMIWTTALPAAAASPDDWFAVSGTCAQADGNQYNSGTLQLLPMDNGCVLFELDVMKGSESEDWSDDFLLSGTFVVEEDGTGTWEEETEAGSVSLRFTLADQTVTVTQKGKLPLPVEGDYTWLEPYFEVTADMAGELVEGLPTATTSLNGNNGAYRLEFSELMVDGWFHDLKAVFVDSGALIGEFLIANDLSAVYRIDTETPMLIYGSADAMMAAAVDVYPEDGDLPETVVQLDGKTSLAEGNAEAAPYSVALVDAKPSSAQVKVGETAQVLPVTPGQIPVTYVCTSDKSAVATVDEAGIITGVAPGTAIISGTLTVDGVEKPFQFEVDVWAPSIQPLQIVAEVPVGGSATMQAKVVGLDQPLKWSVSDNAVAEIDADTGILKGKKDGTVQLLAQAGDLQREWTVAIGQGDAAAPDGASASSATGMDEGANEGTGDGRQNEPEDGPVDHSGVIVLAIAGVLVVALLVGAGVLLAQRGRKSKGR